MSSNIPPQTENLNITSKENIDNQVNPVRKFGRRVSSVINNFGNKIRYKTYEGYNYFGSTEAIIGLIIVIFLAITLSFFVYNFIASSIFNQNRLIISGTKIPVPCTTSNIYDIDYNMKSSNGIRKTFTFWIYIHDMNYGYNQYKNVCYIGSDQDIDIDKRSIHFYLDSKNNKLYVKFLKKKEKTDNNYKSKNISDFILNEIYKESLFVIDYIPIQRWVHVAIVINDSGGISNTANISGYIDSDLVKSIEHNKDNKDLSDLIGISSNKLITGGNSMNIGFSGLISKFSIYNYDLNDKDIYDDYNEGPIDNLLAKLGLGAWGVRSPVYRLT